MEEDLDKPLDPTLPREEWHRRFQTRHALRQRDRAIEADRRWRAAVTAELNRRRGILGWLGLR